MKKTLVWTLIITLIGAFVPICYDLCTTEHKELTIQEEKKTDFLNKSKGSLALIYNDSVKLDNHNYIIEYSITNTGNSTIIGFGNNSDLLTVDNTLCIAADSTIVRLYGNKHSVINTELISDTERKIVYSQRRPNQAKFRKSVLAACERCVITNVSMPEVLEAAHIKPYKYHGADTADNGFAMRIDIHYLFDSGHLRISEHGEVFLSDKARWSYGASIPPRIFIPDYINKEYIRWRWDNYNGM